MSTSFRSTAPSLASGPVAAPARTRIAADERRHQILAATHRVVLQRGLHDLRVADVADELAVSTGLIHYHFATKDELIEAMLREAADLEVSTVRAGLARVARPRSGWSWPSRRTCRRCGGTPSWVLWIDVWGEALRDANLRRISEELDAAWVEMIAEVIADGRRRRRVPLRRPRGVVLAPVRPARRPRPPGRPPPGTMTRAQMHKHVRRRRLPRARLRPPRLTV